MLLFLHYKKVKEKKKDFEEALHKLKSLDTTDIESQIMEQRNSLEKQLEKFERRERNLKEMRMDGEISKAEFLELKEENDKQSKQIQQQIELLNIQHENLSNTDEEEEWLEYTISKLDELEELKPEDCNTFLKTFIKKIHFSSNTETNHDTTKPRENATVKIEWLK